MQGWVSGVMGDPLSPSHPPPPRSPSINPAPLISPPHFTRNVSSPPPHHPGPCARQPSSDGLQCPAPPLLKPSFSEATVLLPRRFRPRTLQELEQQRNIRQHSQARPRVLHCSRCVTCADSLLTGALRGQLVKIPITQGRKLRHKGLQQLARGHTAGITQRQDSNPHRPVARAHTLTLTPDALEATSKFPRDPGGPVRLGLPLPESPITVPLPSAPLSPDPASSRTRLASQLKTFAYTLPSA